MPTIKLKDIFNRNDENKLVLPDFQRDFVWDKEQQKNLLASFITYLPVGTILLLDGKKDDFANKKICFPKESCEPKDDCTYLLDGQQRITSLKSMFTDLFADLDNWAYTWDNIYKDLRNRWFIRLKPRENEEDVFGYENLIFKPLNFYEPSELLGYIECRIIYKTKSTDWYHPAYDVKDNDGHTIPHSNSNQSNYYIAKEPAKQGLVPLFTIYKPLFAIHKADKQITPLHQYAVESIADDRVKYLKATINDIVAIDDRNKEIQKYLSAIQPDLDFRDKESVDKAWSRLAAKWSTDVIYYLEGMLNEEIPIIQLPAEEIGRAVAIFESINRGGTPLDTYDLIVAKAAKNKGLWY